MGLAVSAATGKYAGGASVPRTHGIRHNCHMGSGAAADRVAVGDQAAGMQLSVDAGEAGGIGFAHLTLVARTASPVEEAGWGRRIREARRLPKGGGVGGGGFRGLCF